MNDISALVSNREAKETREGKGRNHAKTKIKPFWPLVLVSICDCHRSRAGNYILRDYKCFIAKSSERPINRSRSRFLPRQCLSLVDLIVFTVEAPVRSFTRKKLGRSRLFSPF